MKTLPKISIITPVLNGIQYLEPCILSSLGQGYSNFEHIFVDGGSTDGTLALLAKYQAKEPDRIRFISEPDRGATDAWQKGWEIAGGDIFGWLGADDTYEPGALETVVEFFRANPEASFVYGDCNYIDASGQVIGKHPTRDFSLAELINCSNYIPAPAAFYKREVIQTVGKIATETPYSGDWDYWIRAGFEFRLYRISTILANFRVHSNSVSFKNSLNGEVIRGGYLINRRYGGRRLSPLYLTYWLNKTKIGHWLFPIFCPIKKGLLPYYCRWLIMSSTRKGKKTSGNSIPSPVLSVERLR